MQQPMPKTTKQPGEAARPAPNACPKCSHLNALDSRYCSACGIPLSISACPHCGAVNTAAAVSCIQCSGSLRESVANAHGAAATAFERLKPPPRPPIPVVAWIVGGAVVGVLAFFGYQAYLTFTYVDFPYERATLPARESGLDGLRGSSYTGTINRAPDAGTNPPATNLEPIVVPPLSPPGKAAAPARSISVPVVEPQAKAAGVAAKIPATTTPPLATIKRSTEHSSPTAQPCTAGVWALGLCTTEPVKPKE